MCTFDTSIVLNSCFPMFSLPSIPIAAVLMFEKHASNFRQRSCHEYECCNAQLLVLIPLLWLLGFCNSPLWTPGFRPFTFLPIVRLSGSLVVARSWVVRIVLAVVLAVGHAAIVGSFPSGVAAIGPGLALGPFAFGLASVVPSVAFSITLHVLLFVAACIMVAMAIIIAGILVAVLIVVAEGFRRCIPLALVPGLGLGLLWWPPWLFPRLHLRFPAFFYLIHLGHELFSRSIWWPPWLFPRLHLQCPAFF